MSSNSPEILRDRGRSLEDEFFRREDQRLVARLKELKETEMTREALGKASGITDPAAVDRLMKLGIQPETVAALAVVPLVEVAWADGSLDAKERRTVVESAGIAKGSAAESLLDAWLERRPDPKLFTAWAEMVKGMCAQLGREDAERLRTGLLARARAVASASGGIFGVGSKVSKAEAETLARLEAAFGPS